MSFFLHRMSSARSAGGSSSDTPIGLLVSQGDSITDVSTGYVEPSLPLLDPQLNINNIAVGGTRMEQWWPLLADTIALFDEIPDTEPKILTIMEGNSLSDGVWNGQTPIENLRDFVDTIRRSPNNIKVLAATTLPRDSGPGFETERSAVNTFWRDNLGLLVDGVCDFDTLPDGMATYPEGAANEDWYPDNIHLTELVYAEMRPIFAAAVNAMVDSFLNDITAPSIERLSPENGDNTILADVGMLALRFSEHVKFTSDVLIELYDDTDTLVLSWHETDIGAGIAIYGIDLEITLPGDLDTGKVYYVNISSGSITDLAGNAFAGISDDTTWTFEVPLVLDLTASLMAYWELEEASGTRADSHGSNDLTDNNTVTQNTGKQGNAAVFTAGNSETLSIADNADLSYSGDFSWSGWLYWTAGSSPQFAGKLGGFGNSEWELKIQFVAFNLVRFATHNSGGTTFNLDAAAGISQNAWQFVTITFVAATSTMTLRFNSGARTTRTITGTIPNSTGAYFLGSNAYSGRMDEVGFWKRALSEAEEVWLYNSGNGRTYADILATAA